MNQFYSVLHANLRLGHGASYWKTQTKVGFQLWSTRRKGYFAIFCQWPLNPL